MKDLPNHVRGALVAIGKAAREDIPPREEDVQLVRPYDAINCQAPGFWQRAAAGLTDEELACLICGLTYVEARWKWVGGSAGGTIWLFRVLEERGAGTSLLDEVSAWVLKHTINPYAPFGSMITSGARNYSEYLVRSFARQLAIRKELERDRQIAEEAREQREQRRALRRRNLQERHSPARKELIERLSGMPVKEQLLLIAADDDHAPNYYPTRCADAAGVDVIRSLPEWARHALAVKLKGRQRGPWGSFKKRLLLIDGPVGDREPWKI